MIFIKYGEGQHCRSFLTAWMVWGDGTDWHQFLASKEVVEITPSLKVPQCGFVQYITDIRDPFEPTKSSQISLERILENIFYLKYLFGSNIT